MTLVGLRKTAVQYLLAVLMVPICAHASICLTHLDCPPKANPWEQLSGMNSPLGRFKLATDDRFIYRLGGVSWDIRAGQSYLKHFHRYDTLHQTWEKLEPVAFGTGNAQITYWPTVNKIVAIAGVETLGDVFDTDGTTVGVYDPNLNQWTYHRFALENLGRTYLLTWSKDSTFFILASDNMAVLDLETLSLTVVGQYPKAGRILSSSRIQNHLYVIEGEQSPQLLHFDIGSTEYIDSVPLNTSNVSWTDSLFTWRGHLFLWSNTGSWDKNSYAYNSAVYHIDPNSGNALHLHPEFPGPKARRSSEGIRCGERFYIFGGQRTDDDWLEDTHQYHLDPLSPYFSEPGVQPNYVWDPNTFLTSFTMFLDDPKWSPEARYIAKAPFEVAHPLVEEYEHLDKLHYYLLRLAYHIEDGYILPYLLNYSLDELKAISQKMFWSVELPPMTGDNIYYEACEAIDGNSGWNVLQLMQSKYEENIISLTLIQERPYFFGTDNPQFVDARVYFGNIGRYLYGRRIQRLDSRGARNRIPEGIDVPLLNLSRYNSIHWIQNGWGTPQWAGPYIPERYWDTFKPISPNTSGEEDPVPTSTE